MKKIKKIFIKKNTNINVLNVDVIIWVQEKQKQKLVEKNVKENTGISSLVKKEMKEKKIQQVYNLTTTHWVYYANWILVSNCDALATFQELVNPTDEAEDNINNPYLKRITQWRPKNNWLIDFDSIFWI
jgi:hypothetical protein